MRPFSSATGFTILAGLITFASQYILVHPLPWLGSSDAASYVAVARSLADGHGFTKDFLEHSYELSLLQFPGIHNPEAHYPPLYSLLAAPFLILFGEDTFPSRLPAMLIGSLLLPLAVGRLARALGANGPAVFAASIAIMLQPRVYFRSLLADDDLLFALLVVLFSTYLMETRTSRRAYLMAGLTAGLGFLAKGLGLVLLPAAAVSVTLLSGTAVLRDRKTWAAFALALLIMLPWMARNSIVFGDPLYTTQKLAAGHFGLLGDEEGGHQLFWDEPRPGLLDKLKSRGPRGVLSSTAEQVATYAKWTFLDDIGVSWRDSDADFLYSSYAGIGALAAYALFVFSIGLRRTGTLRKRIAPSGVPWSRPEMHVLWCVPLLLLMVIAIAWAPSRRIAIMFLALATGLGWAAYGGIARTLLRRGHLSSVLVLLMLLPYAERSIVKIRSDSLTLPARWEESERPWKEAGDWLRTSAPEAIVMSRQPGILNHYSGAKGLTIPFASTSEVLRIIDHYHVTHVIPDLDRRPALAPLISGVTPVLELVQSGELSIYAVRRSSDKSR